MVCLSCKNDNYSLLFISLAKLFRHEPVYVKRAARKEEAYDERYQSDQQGQSEKHHEPKESAGVRPVLGLQIKINSDEKNSCKKSTNDDFFGDQGGSLVGHQPLLHLGDVHHCRLATVRNRRHHHTPKIKVEKNTKIFFQENMQIE